MALLLAQQKLNHSGLETITTKNVNSDSVVAWQPLTITIIVTNDDGVWIFQRSPNCMANIKPMEDCR